MDLLLDTSIFLWYISNDKRLPKRILKEIQNRDNNIYLSVISIWECLIKKQINKIDLPEPTAEYLIKQRELHQINPLQFDEKSTTYLAELPAIHKDPFDRILICQAKGNNFILVTTDALIKKYSINIL